MARGRPERKEAELFDLLVSGGTVVTPAGTQALDVAVQDGTIAGVLRPGLALEARRRIDASGCLVLPGGIDPHVHYNVTFGGVTSEGQEFSHACALGGTTTILDFVFHEAYAEPYRTVHDAVAAKRLEADGNIAVDYGIHVCLAGNPPDAAIEEIGDLIRAGLPTIKTMTTYGFMSDDGHRLGVMAEVARHGGLSVIHAEDDAIMAWLTARLVREGKTHGGYIAEARPALAEEAAVRRAIVLAEHTGSPLYVLHVAAERAARAIAEARGRGLPVYGESLATYLSFTGAVLFDDARRGLLWNNYPTLKTQADQDGLWAALARDDLQCVGSDHLAHTARQRYEVMGSTVDSLQCGQVATELRLPVVYHRGVVEGRLSLERFVDVVSTNPAKLMGLYPRKGAIAPGSDADLVVLDPARRWTVRADELHMSSDFSCWEGWELQGKVRDTILRGEVLVEGGAYVGSRTGGRFLERRIAPQLLATPPNLAWTAPRGRYASPTAAGAASATAMSSL